MIELFVAVITIVGGIITTRARPSLDHRIKDHAALLKELPDGLSKVRLKGLLEEEVAAQVDRDRRRVSAETHWKITIVIRSAGWFGVTLGAFMTVYLLAANLVTSLRLDDRPSWLVGILVITTIAVVVAVGAWALRAYQIKGSKPR